MAFVSKTLMTIAASLLITSLQAQGEPSGANNDFGRRASNREAKRWTLQDWLDTKDRNRMMDLWLSLNSASPYEAMVSAAYKSYLRDIDVPKTQNSFTSVDGSVTAHAHIVGLTVDYENNPQEKLNDLSGMLNLRLFGESIQSSYLALHFGQRTRTYSNSDTPKDYKNQFGQVSLQLYLMKYFGIDGFHRIYISSTNDIAKEEIAGSISEAGIFIDFKALRIFGAAYRDYEIIKSTITPFVETSTIRSGSRAGVKIYF